MPLTFQFRHTTWKNQHNLTILCDFFNYLFIKNGRQNSGPERFVLQMAQYFICKFKNDVNLRVTYIHFSTTTKNILKNKH
jgi:hypothetical protein